jgi:hypothetical protein
VRIVLAKNRVIARIVLTHKKMIVRIVLDLSRCDCQNSVGS